ncbi:Mov34/MPN/PAD-1 family protein [Rhodopseudomonas sp.]|uniref:Mov34/MPN/PAD-1 family protein n=1 Tax=Rhodopseudomonas sp. TaxID=1078 RepID=UPI0039E48C69
MSDDAVNLTIGPICLQICPDAIATFTKHRQRCFFSRESGGQLFARVRGNNWEIVAATGPKTRDSRSRFGFRPHRPSEQEEIFEYHRLGYDYVGDWHTHPQDVPHPSPDDLESIRNLVRESIHHLPGFLLMIVGRDRFPKGLWCSFHSLDGSFVSGTVEPAAAKRR